MFALKCIFVEVRQDFKTINLHLNATKVKKQNPWYGCFTVKEDTVSLHGPEVLETVFFFKTTYGISFNYIQTICFPQH